MIRRLSILILLVLLLLTISSGALAQPREYTFTPLPADWLGDIFDGLSDWLVNTLNGLAEWIGGAFQWIFDAFGTLFGWFVDGLNFIGSIISTVFGWFVNGLNLIIIAIGDLGRWVFSFFEMLYQAFLNGLETVADIAGIIGQLIGVVLAVIGLVISWIGQVVTQFLIMIGVITNAQMIPVPYLPRCVTAPTESQVCAVWYIFDNTLFSSTPGIWIVSLLVLVIDVFIALYVFRKVMKMVRGSEQMLDVTG